MQQRLVIENCDQSSETHLPETHHLYTLLHMISDGKNIIRKTQGMHHVCSRMHL